MENALNQTSKFRRKNIVEINDYVRWTSNTNSQISFKTPMLKSSLCRYSDTYIDVTGSITVFRAGATKAALQVDRNNQQAISKIFVHFTDCITEISYTQVDNTKDFDVLVPMYNLIDSKTLGSLRQFCKDEPKNSWTNSE